MKFQESSWRFKSPGPFPQSAFWQIRLLIDQIAGQGNVQDILEEFKWAFSNGTSSRSSTASWAETDLYNIMDRAADNAPVFIEAFVKTCKELGEQGLDVPSVDHINSVLSQGHVGYQIIGGDTIRAAPYQDVSDEPNIEELFGDVPGAPTSASTTGTSSAAGSTKLKSLTLKIFLCHSSCDKASVADIYARLKHRGYDPWLDSVNLLPGQDWEAEIKKAVKSSHVVIVLLSRSSVSKTGFVQKEIRFALDVADEQPEGHIFIIPARLEDGPVPERLGKWHWVNLYEEHGFIRLCEALDMRIGQL